jgi:RNA polymerase sigma-70 factor (ECF subfamily)
MQISHDADEWHMAQVALGKRQHLEPLVRRYAGPLLTFIRRMVGDVHRSEELFQEVFLRVWVKRSQYRFPLSFRSWLFAIAANHCRASFRRRQLQVVSIHGDELGEPAAQSALPAEAAITTERSLLVEQAVRLLPVRQRTVVTLRVWNGMSYAEIAEVMGCGESTVRSHMHHGLAALRTHLEARLGRD